MEVRKFHVPFERRVLTFTLKYTSDIALEIDSRRTQRGGSQCRALASIEYVDREPSLPRHCISLACFYPRYSCTLAAFLQCFQTFVKKHVCTLAHLASEQQLDLKHLFSLRSHIYLYGKRFQNCLSQNSCDPFLTETNKRCRYYASFDNRESRESILNALL